MHLRRLLRPCVLLLASACARLGEDPVADPPSAAAHVVATPETNTAVLAPLSEEATAYLADCHHRFEKPQEETGQVMTECTFREFDQNCSPDPSGCWDKGQACRDACGGPCTSCDDACGGSCDGCRSKCSADDTACAHRCAETRVSCRDACLAARDKCADTECSKAEETCNAEHLATREKLCPKCEQINACMNDAMGNDAGPLETCAPKFKREPKQCLEWCFEF